MPNAAAILPPSARAARRIDPQLVLALAQALQTVQRSAALAELGDIDLPDSAPTPEDVRQLETIAPLYLASELEQAGLLRTAELIAGLFASGAITQPLGPTASLIAEFWKTRRERMAAVEREQLFSQVFDPHGFFPLMQALCEALTEQLDHPSRPGDVHARVLLQEAAEALGAWLAPRATGMASYAAQDIVQALSQATHFLRERLLQTAFGVHDLWGLLDTVGSTQGVDAGQARRHVELGRQGATVLAGLANGLLGGTGFDPGHAAGRQLIAAAEAWQREWADGHG